MAARNFAPTRSINREIVVVEGSFAPNGSSAVSATSRKGLGWSVARTGVGTFTLTFTDKFNDLVAFSAHLQLATAADSVVQMNVVDLSAKTITITILTAGSAADIAADTNNRVHFIARFRNSAVTPVRG